MKSTSYKMVSRTTLTFLAIGLFVALTSARSVEQVDVDISSSEIVADYAVSRGFKDYLQQLAKEAGLQAVKAALSVLQDEIAQIKFECLEEIYDFCKINPIKHPNRFYKCGKAWYKEHKSRCRKDKEDPAVDAKIDDFASEEDVKENKVDNKTAQN